MNVEKYHRTRTIPELTERDKARFWAKVKKLGPDDCWEWQAFKNRGGYGLFSIRRDLNKYLANRISFFIHNNIRHAREDIRHTCDNPPCCNPAHLIPGSIGDNVRDAVERGLYKHGENHHLAKLTDVDVIQIRRKYEENIPMYAIARECGILRSHVWYIVNRRIWKHLPPQLPPKVN